MSRGDSASENTNIKRGYIDRRWHKLVLPHPHRWQINSKVQQQNIKHGYSMCTLPFKPFKSQFYLKTTSNMKHDQTKKMNQLRQTNQTIEKRSKQITSQCISTSFPNIREFTYSKPTKLELKASLGNSRLEHEHSASDTASSISRTPNLYIK